MRGVDDLLDRSDAGAIPEPEQKAMRKGLKRLGASEQVIGEIDQFDHAGAKLEDVLGSVTKGYGFHADLSPKNLCWCNDRWVLLDTGEPLVANAFAESVLQRISWDAYLAFHAPKIRSRRSQPSALTIATRPDELDLRAATPYAFVREWWLWLPCVVDVAPGLLRATFDAAARDDEILFLMEQDGGGWHLRPAPRGDPGMVTPELAVKRAVEEWRRSFPDRPCSLPATPPQPRDPCRQEPRSPLPRALARDR